MRTEAKRRDVFQAIADPNRRQILHMLSQSELNLNAIAEKFEISRPAVSKHIKILSECGLIEIDQRGRERYCRAKLQKLKEGSSWVDQYKRLWEEQFDSLDHYLNQIQSTNHESE